MTSQCVQLFQIVRYKMQEPQLIEDKFWSRLEDKKNLSIETLDSDYDDRRIAWLEEKYVTTVEPGGRANQLHYLVQNEAFIRVNSRHGLIFFSGSKAGHPIIHRWIWKGDNLPTFGGYTLVLRDILLQKDIKTIIQGQLQTIVVENLAIDKIANATLSARCVDLEVLQALLISPYATVRSVTLTSRRDLSVKMQIKSNGIIRLSQKSGESWSERIDFLQTFFEDLGLWR